MVLLARFEVCHDYQVFSATAYSVCTFDSFSSLFPTDNMIRLSWEELARGSCELKWPGSHLLISAFCILVSHDTSSNEAVQQLWCRCEIRAATRAGLCGLPGLWWRFPALADTQYSRSQKMQKASGVLEPWSRVLAPCFSLSPQTVQEPKGCVGTVCSGYLAVLAQQCLAFSSLCCCVLFASILRCC